MFTTSDFIQSPNSKQSNTKQYVLYTFIFLIILSLGILIGLEIPVIRHRTYNDGWNSAKARLAESPQFGFLTTGPEEVGTLYGVIQSIEPNKILIKIDPIEPFADPKLDTRTIVMNESTKFTRVFLRTSEDMKKENDTSLKKSEDVNNIVQPFTIKETQKDTLAVGQTVSVVAQGNIKNTQIFPALEIQIQ